MKNVAPLSPQNFSVVALGCRTNLYESEAVASMPDVRALGVDILIVNRRKDNIVETFASRYAENFFVTLMRKLVRAGCRMCFHLTGPGCSALLETRYVVILAVACPKNVEEQRSLTMQKHEWKKHEKNLYLPKNEPMLLTVPRQKFFAIQGKGNPNDVDFSERIGVLYALAYAVRMMPKSGFTPKGYFEYTVYPLEGVWQGGDATDKSKFVYTIMIRQPGFVVDEIVEKAFESVGRKKPHPLLSEAFFCEMEDGLSVQMLHSGDYDNEPHSFAAMQRFMDDNGLFRREDSHREIYLTDANKVERDKLKTVLRYTVHRK